jgi:hypothetical protein
MKLTESQIRKIIKNTLSENKIKNKGSAVLIYDKYDAIGDGFKMFLGIDIKIPPTGHGRCAIITPIDSTKGSVTCINFGPPLCNNKNDKLSMMYKSLAKSVGINLPIIAPMIVTVTKAPGTVPLENFYLKEKGAIATVKKLRSVFGIGEQTYVAVNGVNPNIALTVAGKNKRCKFYSIIPIGLTGSWVMLLEIALKKFGIDIELDLDNCASFALDVVSAGLGKNTNKLQLLSSPNLMIQAARAAFAPTISGKA